MISTERIYKRKQKGYLNLWSLAAVYVVTVWGQEGKVHL